MRRLLVALLLITACADEAAPVDVGPCGYAFECARDECNGPGMAWWAPDGSYQLTVAGGACVDECMLATADEFCPDGDCPAPIADGGLSTMATFCAIFPDGSACTTERAVCVAVSME